MSPALAATPSRKSLAVRISDITSVQRRATRIVNRHRHEEGNDLANCRGDIIDMMTFPGPGVTLSDTDRLDAVLRFLDATHAPDQRDLLLPGPHWSAFVGIRRQYVADRSAHRQRGFQLRTGLTIPAADTGASAT